MSDRCDPPDHAGAQILDMIRPAVPSLEKLTPTTRLKHIKVHEPSPASTVGDSEPDSSNPSTPKDARVHDLTQNIGNLLVTDIHGSSQHQLVYGSKCLMLDENGSHGLVPKLSPSKPLQNGAANRSAPSDNSPETNAQLYATHPNPNWNEHPSNGFVLSSDSKDDPFVTSERPIVPSSLDSAGTTYRVREDRAGDSPTPGTAQAHFSPDACVFVANLLQTATDQQLEHAVTANFSQFGTVYVKIRRDGRGMPFAFAQYETEVEAQHAVTQGRNIPILGRHCRTEIAKVNRTLYLSKIAGGEVSHEEARDVLKDYGAIEELHYASSTDRALYGLPQGIFVRFHFYDDCRDAQVRFRVHDGYRLEQARIPEDMRSTPSSRSGPRRSLQFSTPGFSNISPSRFSPQSSASIGLKCDDCSIFVGNLPPKVNEARIHENFATFGRILSVVICPKPFGAHSVVASAFAFVEFSTRGEAIVAVQRASRLFEGYQIRVEHKVPKRLFTVHGGSPTSVNQLEKSQLPVPTQDMLMMLYHRGVEVGMNHAAQAQAITPHIMTNPVYASYGQPYYPHYDGTVGMFATSNGPPPAYNLGPQVYHSGPVSTTLSPSDYLPASVTAAYVQHDESSTGLAQNALIREEDLAYAWPLPAGDQRLLGSSSSHQERSS